MSDLIVFAVYIYGMAMGWILRWIWERGDAHE